MPCRGQDQGQEEVNDENAKEIASALKSIAGAINWVGFSIVIFGAAVYFGLLKMC